VLLVKAQLLETTQHEHGDDRGGEAHRLAKWHAGIAVDVGHHAANATQPTGNDGRLPRQTQVRTGEAIADAERGADGNVSFETGH
jgi:hypothetical protein